MPWRSIAGEVHKGSPSNWRKRIKNESPVSHQSSKPIADHEPNKAERPFHGCIGIAVCQDYKKTHAENHDRRKSPDYKEPTLVRRELRICHLLRLSRPILHDGDCFLDVSSKGFSFLFRFTLGIFQRQLQWLDGRFGVMLNGYALHVEEFVFQSDLRNARIYDSHVLYGTDLHFTPL